MGGTLLCGAAAMDITPRAFVPGIRLAGFGFNRRATEVLDPLEAVALHLDDGKRGVTLVSVDLIGLGLPYVERVRARVSEEEGEIYVCATHCHSAPDTIGLWGRSIFGVFPLTSGVEEAYMEQVVRGIGAAVWEARRSVRPVKVKVNRFDVPSEWTRNDRRGGGKEDFGYVLAFEGEDGRRVATVVQFATHPETLWEKNTLVSADYPGHVRRRLREVCGGEALFFSGALGGMVTPNVPLDWDLERRKAEIGRLGKGIGDLAAAAVEEGEVLESVGLFVKRAKVELPLRNLRFRVAGRMGLIRRDFVLDSVLSEVFLVRIGEEVSILSAPGECTPEAGRKLVSLLPGRYRMVFGLGCDEVGYILTEEQFADKEYRYERSMSLGPETLERLIRVAKGLVEKGAQGDGRGVEATPEEGSRPPADRPTTPSGSPATPRPARSLKRAGSRVRSDVGPDASESESPVGKASRQGRSLSRTVPTPEEQKVQ